MLRKPMRDFVRMTALIVVVLVAGGMAPAAASEPLIIAASPSLATPLGALARAFEASHPDVKVRLYFDSGLDLRRTIAAMENHPTGQYFIGSGPIHIIAPGGDELITRLEQKYYVLPQTRRPYATVSLVLVVPESLVDAPSSFEALGQDTQDTSGRSRSDADRGWAKDQRALEGVGNRRGYERPAGCGDGCSWRLGSRAQWTGRCRHYLRS